MNSNIYHIISKTETTTDTWRYELRLNAQHAIFAAHFPGYPILPGACLLQICKDLTADMLNQVVEIAEASNIKFTEAIVPNVHAEFAVVLTWLRTENKVKIVVSKNTTTFAKLTLQLR